jgi:3-phosphoshikimate 1-carboxyvinyltransferase
MFLNIRHRHKPIKDTISLPGDKSIAQRAIILSAIAEGKSILRNVPLSDDCLATINCIRQLGVEIATSRCSSGLAMTNTLTIKGKGLYGLKKPVKPLNVSESGTAARLLTGLLSAQKFPSVITGEKTLLKRPMDRVIEPLSRMGAKIKSTSGRLPISISPSNLKSIEYRLPVPSAQVKSAILLAGLYAKGKTVIYEPIPTRDHTERLLNIFTAKTQRTQRITLCSLCLCGESLKPISIKIPGDFSSASYFIAAGILVPGSEITIKDVGLNLYRVGLFTVLKRMNGAIRKYLTSNIQHPTSKRWTEPVGNIIVKHSLLKGIKISGKIIPSIIDEIPILALIATQAKGTTIIKGASELRLKESNRIRAIKQELLRLGADIRETNDGLIIKGPTKLYGATCPVRKNTNRDKDISDKLKQGAGLSNGVKMHQCFATACSSHNDHRIALMLSIAGLIAEGKTRIENAEVINKSFPSFRDFDIFK